MSNTPHPVQDVALQPQAVADGEALAQHLIKSPLVLRGIFVELTRQVYYDVANGQMGVKVQWNEDPAKTQMWIDTDYRWEDEAPEFRPAIYVKIMPLSFSNYDGRNNSLIDMDLKEGTYMHNRTGTGTVQWTHIGRTAGEAVLLAGNTFDIMSAFAVQIRDEFCFDVFQMVSIGDLSVDKESQERYRMQCSGTFTFQEAWSVKMESPKLKRLVFTAGQNLLARGTL